jgi:hypothetical protein
MVTIPLRGNAGKKVQWAYLLYASKLWLDWGTSHTK